MRGIACPVAQHPEEPLKTEISRTPVPIPQDLVLVLPHHVVGDLGRAPSWILH